MKIIVWAKTNRLGSKDEMEIDIPDEDLDGLEKQTDNYLEDVAKEAMWELIEWGWTKAYGGDK